MDTQHAGRENGPLGETVIREEEVVGIFTLQVQDGKGFIPDLMPGMEIKTIQHSPQLDEAVAIIGHAPEHRRPIDPNVIEDAYRRGRRAGMKEVKDADFGATRHKQAVDLSVAVETHYPALLAALKWMAKLSESADRETLPEGAKDVFSGLGKAVSGLGGVGLVDVEQR